MKLCPVSYKNNYSYNHFCGINSNISGTSNNDVLENKSKCNKDVIKNTASIASAAFMAGLFIFFFVKPDKISKNIKQFSSKLFENSNDIVAKGKELFSETEELILNSKNHTLDKSKLPHGVVDANITSSNDNFSPFSYILKYFRDDNSYVSALLDDNNSILSIMHKKSQANFSDFYTFDENLKVSTFNRNYGGQMQDSSIFKNEKIKSFTRTESSPNSRHCEVKTTYLFNNNGICTLCSKTGLKDEEVIYEKRYVKNIFGKFQLTSPENTFDLFSDGNGLGSIFAECTNSFFD